MLFFDLICYVHLSIEDQKVGISDQEIAMAKTVFSRVPVPIGLNGKPNMIAAWIDFAGEASGCTMKAKSQELSNYIATYLKSRGVNDRTITEAFGATTNSFLMPIGLQPSVDAAHIARQAGQVMMTAANPGQVAAMDAEKRRQIRLKVWLSSGQMIGDVQTAQIMEKLQNGGEEWSTQRQGRILANAEMELLRATRTNMVQRPGR
jgi:hypothetical protein